MTLREEYFWHITGAKCTFNKYKVIMHKFEDYEHLDVRFSKIPVNVYIFSDICGLYGPVAINMDK